MPHGERLAFGLPIVTEEVFNFLDATQMTLQVQCWSDAARTVTVRGFTRHGFISHDHVTNSDRSVSTTTFELQDFPLSFQVATTSAPVRRGSLFTRITLQMGGFNVACLAAGYITDDQLPSYPHEGPYKSIEGYGLIRSITGTNPAAGVEISETVPTNARWRLLAMAATYVADATVATRAPMLVFDDGTTEYMRIVPGVGITASQTIICTWGDVGDDSSTTGVLGMSVLPNKIFLPQAHRIRTVTNNLQAGDNWGAPQLLVEEWIQE